MPPAPAPAPAPEPAAGARAGASAGDGLAEPTGVDPRAPPWPVLVAVRVVVPVAALPAGRRHDSVGGAKVEPVERITRPPLPLLPVAPEAAEEAGAVRWGWWLP